MYIAKCLSGFVAGRRLNTSYWMVIGWLNFFVLLCINFNTSYENTKLCAHFYFNLIIVEIVLHVCSVMCTEGTHLHLPIRP